MMNGRDASVINVWSNDPVWCDINICRDILIESDKTSMAMMSITSGHRAFKISRVFLISVIFVCLKCCWCYFC